MRVIHYHISALKLTFEALAKGRFLLFFLPGVIVSILFGGIYMILHSVVSLFGVVEHVPFIGSFLFGAVTHTVSLFDFLLSQFYIFFILTLLSPFNTVLSGRFDAYLTGNRFSGGFSRFASEFFRMVFLVVLALILEFGLLLIWYGLNWVFDFGLLNTLVKFTLSSFFFGFAFYDYSLERHDIGVLGSLGYAFSKPFTMFVSGALFNLLFAIPLIGVLLAPVIVTMVSTAVFLKHRNMLPVQTHSMKL